MPGPPPKPPERRRRRNPRTSTERAVEWAPSVTDGTPKPPANLSPALRSAWRDFFASSLAKIVQYETDGPALRRLWGLYADRERVTASIAQVGMVVDGMRGPALNPLIKLVGDADKEIRALEDRFGLSPLARMRLGVAFGDAKRSLDELSSVEGGGNDELDPR